MKLFVLATASACSHAPLDAPGQHRPAIDRFSAAAHLMVRTPTNHLPRPDEPIDFDRPPFITQSFGPDGAVVRYYNFDVQADHPATLWRITRAGTREALAGQLDVVDRIPGDPGYSDFWRIAWVEVPPDFVAGSITSADQLRGYAITSDPRILNCPIVPRGSTAREGHGVAPAVATELWYRGAKLTCLGFGEPLHEQDGRVPTSPIFVTFARNPGTPGGGPASGFRSESRAPTQTHNVVFSVPGDTDYSPLWAVHIYDRTAFDQVHDAASALRAPLVTKGPLVNCPIVYVAPK
ncbi:MAG: hypothetical protein ABI591_28235 [Kofleriaceae bacterium]